MIPLSATCSPVLFCATSVAEQDVEDDAAAVPQGYEGAAIVTSYKKSPVAVRDVESIRKDHPPVAAAGIAPPIASSSAAPKATAPRMRLRLRDGEITRMNLTNKKYRFRAVAFYPANRGHRSCWNGFGTVRAMATEAWRDGRTMYRIDYPSGWWVDIMAIRSLAALLIIATMIWPFLPSQAGSPSLTSPAMTVGFRSPSRGG